MKRVVCENQQGQKIEFKYDGYPLRLESTSGFSSTEYTVHTSQNSGQDGEHYNGAKANKRNPVITANIFENFPEWGDRLRSFFQPRSWGTVYAYESDDDVGRKATYQVEKIDIDESGMPRDATISLICPDPKFYALNDQLTQLAVWHGCIRFPLRITEPFHVTEKVNTLIGNVNNPSAVPMGLTVKFMASGTVVNPSLYDVNRRELMQINTTMHAGDVIVITTADGNKRVKLISGGVTTNINNLMVYPPKWLKAYQGDNLFRYNADEGIDNLSVSILSTQAYWGA
ncbi:phage tail family protein [Caproiciproducens galactitolivorans]|uniref:Phage tail protein n=1 Tax=Caproiciproducens galactitolivorans TaxID=642589 RepID=A0A4Z0XVB7_9FIRM|nr:phage tail domain-containing protein [Caproiciproducens galactitolivorans]QEY33879.1 phage tail family protein [Caproiciproducens galactitolivorans]TGJ75389.1 phage tail protein [Caproiciproducens galactitolivorans]